MFKKIFELLNQFQRKKAILLLFLILIMSLMEMASIAVIFLFIQMLIKPDLIDANVILVEFYKLFNYFRIIEIREFQFLFGLIVFIILVLSVSIRAVTYYIQIRFSYLCEYFIGRRLVENYLHQSYQWFFDKNTSSFGKNILSEVNKVIIHGVIPMTTILAQGSIAITLVAFIFITNPILAFNSLVTLSLTYALIYFLAKNFLLKFGLQNIKANDDRFRILSEAFNSIKEIKVNGVENVYCRYFDKPSKIYALSQSSTQLISNLPRYFLEAVVFGGMIIFLIILIKNKNDFMDIVPIVAIYIFAAYRLIPSLQQIYYSLTQISYAKPAINLLIKDLSRLKYIRQKSNDIPRMKFLKLLKFNKVYFAYSNSKKITLKNINISIKAFSKVGIIGQTGSGKSTIADLILGLISPLEGNIKIDANILTNKNIKSWQKNIGYVPQQVNLVDDTIAANIAFGVDKVDIDYRIIERCLKIANLYKFVIKELPNSYNTIVGERGIRLSGGQRQRIGIARALYHNPQVIILDEATNSLDSLTEEKVMSSIKNLGRNITIIIIAHRLSTLKDCDKLFLIDQGEVKAEGTYNELVSKNKKFKNYKH